MQSSLVLCFEMALAKTLIEKGLITKEELKENVRHFRKLIPYQSELKISETVITDFTEFMDERLK